MDLARYLAALAKQLDMARNLQGGVSGGGRDPPRQEPAAHEQEEVTSAGVVPAHLVYRSSGRVQPHQPSTTAR